jgi:hypothetical protein
MQKSGMFLDLLAPALVSLVVSLLVLAGLTRKVWNLQMDIAGLQAQFLRERNQRASLTRSKDKEALELFRDIAPTKPPVNKINPLNKFGIGG